MMPLLDNGILVLKTFQNLEAQCSSMHNKKSKVEVVLRGDVRWL